MELSAILRVLTVSETVNSEKAMEGRNLTVNLTAAIKPYNGFMPRLASGAKSKIDELPEAERSKVINALLAGKSLREVAKLSGISHVQVAAYKRTVMAPAMRTAMQLQSIQQDKKPNNKPNSELANLTREVIKASPFRERLEKLWQRTDNAIERAENAVRVVKDKDGNIVDIAEDLSALAPLLNQAHKNVAILGKATGELVEAAPVNVAIQIVMPATPQQPEADVIDVEAEAPTYTLSLEKPR